MSNNEVQSRKGVAETSPSQVQPSEPTPTEKLLEQTPRDKSVVKRPLAPSVENSEICNKKMRAEEVHDLFAQLKSEDMEPFKGGMGAFCEIINEFVKMGKKNAELNREVEAVKEELAAAKVVAEGALEKAKELENRAEKAEKAEKEMMRKNAELNRDVEAGKKELAAANGTYEKALKIAKDSDNRAEMAEKTVEHWNKSYKSLIAAMVALCEVINFCAKMVSTNAALNWEVEAAKKEIAAANRTYERALKHAENRAETAEKAVEHWKKSYQSIWKKAEDSSKRAKKAY